MNKFRFTINLLAIAIFTLAFASMTQAQATRTWVSGVGDDANPCSRTAPCKTFAGAISKTAVDGEIDALDPGGFGTVTITKAITIDGGTTGEASILASGTNGVNITISASSGSNVVELRNLSINGAGTGTNGIRITASQSGVSVFVENCVIFGFRAGTGRGITDERTVAGNLFVQNTLVKNNSGSGIVVIGAAGTGAAVLDNVQSEANGSAGFVVSGANKSMITRNCVGGKNAGAGFFAENTAKLDVINSLSGLNATGIESDAGAEVRVSRSTITRNTTNGLGLGGGTILSYGTNEVSANVGAELFTAGGPTLK